MITAILDTNVFVRAAIHHPRSASVRTLDAYYDGKYQLILSPPHAMNWSMYRCFRRFVLGTDGLTTSCCGS
jgi:hypothetical protein